MGRITPFTLLLLFLMQACTTAPTFEQEFHEKFNRSFDANCQEKVQEQALRDYSTVSGITAEHVSAEIREKIKENASPLFAACTCVREKLATKVDEKSSTHIQITMDATVLFNDTALGCAPNSETRTRVSQGLLSLVLTTPAPAQLLSTKRAAFSLTVSVSVYVPIDPSSKVQPSLFASYYRPPESLPRLVFLAPGTGSACPDQEICVDSSSLKISSASDLLAIRAESLGPEASANLRRVIDQFGDRAPVITSGRNYSNFVPSETPTVMPSRANDAFVYPVATIDRQPVEKTTVKRVWVVVFHSLRAYSTWDDFVPALTGVH